MKDQLPTGIRRFLIHLHYSLLLSLPPLLWLYIKNWDGVRLIDLLVPIGIIIMILSTLYSVLSLITKNSKVVSVFTSIIGFMLFSFSSFTKFLYQHPIFINAIDMRAEKVIVIVYILFIVIIILYKRKFLKYSNRIFNVLFIMGVIMISTPFYLITRHEIYRLAYSDVHQVQLSFSGEVPNNSPDIYYLIIERFANFQTLKSRYQFESSLENFLEKETFYIAKNSRPNYPHTSLSLASSLNLSYLDYFSRYKQMLKGDETHLFNQIENSQLFSFLKENNYELFYLTDSWQGTEKNRNADTNFNYHYPSAFTKLFLETTIYDYIYKKYYYLTRSKHEPYKIQKKESEVFKLNKLKEITKKGNKKVVFAHLLITHEPYVLNKIGQPLTDEEIVNTPHETRYINHIQFGGEIVKKMIKAIKKNKRPYILIIQADEGPYTKELRRLVDRDKFKWSKASPDAIKTHMSILNAYYFPDEKYYKSLNASISPVNSFRVVLNSYFDQRFPMLEDRYFLNHSFNNLYQFKDITGILK